MMSTFIKEEVDKIAELKKLDDLNSNYDSQMTHIFKDLLELSNNLIPISLHLSNIYAGAIKMYYNNTKV